MEKKTLPIRLWAIKFPVEKGHNKPVKEKKRYLGARFHERS